MSWACSPGCMGWWRREGPWRPAPHCSHVGGGGKVGRATGEVQYRQAVGGGMGLELVTGRGCGQTSPCGRANGEKRPLGA